MTATDTPDTDAPPREPKLGFYLGKPVTRASFEIRGTGAGLDKSLHMPAVELGPGRYDVVLRCELDKHRHEMNDDGETWTLVHMFRAESATLPEPTETAADALARADREIEKRRDGVDERQLTLDGARGGAPVAVGDVLDNVTALIEGADARNGRLTELETWSKDDLKERAAELDLPGRSKLTVAELRDAIVDHELEHGLLDDAEDEA